MWWQGNLFVLVLLSIEVRGVSTGPYRILRASSPSIPSAVAAVLLYIRDQTGVCPHAYFEWGEGNPLAYIASFLLLGKGDIAPVTRKILRKAEPNPER